MGSADQQFSLAEILSQTYGVREECEEMARRPEQREEGLDKDFVSQVPCGGRAGLWPLRSCSARSCFPSVLGAAVTGQDGRVLPSGALGPSTRGRAGR